VRYSIASDHAPANLLFCRMSHHPFYAQTWPSRLHGCRILTTARLSKLIVALEFCQRRF